MNSLILKCLSFIWNQDRKFVRQSLTWIAVLFGWAFATTVHASCAFDAGSSYSSPLVTTQPLTISNLTVGRDVPDGTVIYTQNVTPQGIRTRCTNGTHALEERDLIVRPRPVTTWNVGKFAGKVYETGVAGIGVAMWRNNDVYPMTFDRGTCSTGSGDCITVIPGNFVGLSISLIKIGPVSPGTISGASLPTGQWRWALSDGPSPFVIATINFSGSIRITSQTCTTPDVTVALGEHKVSEFPSVGSVTPWKSFNIRLQNCPAFYGASASLTRADSATGWAESNKTVNPNVLQFSLEATNGTAAIYQGTVRLSPTTSGPASATGIGVQIADDSLTPVKFLTLMPTNITPTDTSGANYTIPLQARYIRITGALAPGPANAAVMFTINYQ